MAELKALNLLSLCGEGGCSAKLPARQLETLLRDLNWNTTPEVLVGLETGDDAGVYLLSKETGLILTTDFFPPFCEDAALYGEVAAVNALSDVYAMGGEALAALNITLFPPDEAYRPLLREILQGGTQAVRRAGIPIIGGHTIANSAPVYGLAILGKIDPAHLITNDKLEVGQTLLLTKPLGVGIVMAASRLHIASPKAYKEATRWLRTLNAQAVPVMRKYGVQAATDVTGFSLMGHAYKMARASHVAIELQAHALPVLPQVAALVEMGCIPGAVFSNRASVGEHCTVASHLPRWLTSLLYDPQTSGGILMTVDAAHASQAIDDLKAAGYEYTTAIGTVIEKSDHPTVHCR